MLEGKELNTLPHPSPFGGGEVPAMGSGGARIFAGTAAAVCGAAPASAPKLSGPSSAAAVVHLMTGLPTKPVLGRP